MVICKKTYTKSFCRNLLHCMGLLASLDVPMGALHPLDHHCKRSWQHIAQCLVDCCSVSG